MKIKDLRIKEREKMVLEDLKNPLGIAQVAAILDVGYGTAAMKLKVWEAKEWVIRIKRFDGTLVYHLNLNFFEEE